MGILDEAIREHMELKRQHGAGDSELKKIEDEAFGPAERPGDGPPADPLAEAPTEFLAQPQASAEAEEAEPRSRREGPSIADLQEPPQIEHEPVAEVPEPTPQPEPEPPPEPEPTPHPEPEAEPVGHSTEEREAIAEQPTEMYDVEGELGAPSPSDDDLLEEEIVEPRLGPTDPLAGLEEDAEAEVSVAGPVPEDEEDDEFWSEQRLSEELDQALEAPLGDEEEEQPAVGTEASQEEEPAEQQEPRPRGDVLDETPDFLEETPEDDELWFEQKPPKDFDFDD